MKLGILGTGKIVQSVLPLMPGLGLPYCALLATGRSRERAERLARDHGVDRVFFDYEEMLASDIDTVYVALPNHLHFDFARQAVGAGKHVILEKPAAATSRELRTLADLALEQGVYILEATNIHFMPAFKALKEDLAKIGTPRIASFNYSQYSSRYEDFKKGLIHPVFDPEKAGGSLMDINFYNIEAALSLFGVPGEIHYSANIERGIDTSGILLMDYPGFKVVCIGAKDCSAGASSTIQGDLATIEIDQPINFMDSYKIAGHDGSREIRAFDRHPYRWYYEFAEFKRIIDEGDTGEASRLLELPLHTMEILDSARRKAGISLFHC